jgi:phage shock protein A
MLNQYVRDLEDARDQTAHEVAVASANVKITQQNIDAKTHLIDLDTQRAKAYLAQNNEAAARATASRIHDEQVELDSLKEQISTATTNLQQMQAALEQINSKHDQSMSQLRRLQSEDSSARALDHANAALKSAAALTSNNVADNVDNISAKIHQHNMVANEEFNQTVAQFAEPADPLKDAAVDDILASLRPVATKAA